MRRTSIIFVLGLLYEKIRKKVGTPYSAVDREADHHIWLNQIMLGPAGSIPGRQNFDFQKNFCSLEMKRGRGQCFEVKINLFM